MTSQDWKLFAKVLRPMNAKFEFLIGSPIDRENLICEIYYNKQVIAEISQETEELQLEIYCPDRSGTLSVSLDEFQNALNQAKQLLKNQTSHEDERQRV